MGYEITSGDEYFKLEDMACKVNAFVKTTCPDSLKQSALEVLHSLYVGDFGLAGESIRVLHEVREYVKDNKEVLDAIDYILKLYEEE